MGMINILYFALSIFVYTPLISKSEVVYEVEYKQIHDFYKGSKLESSIWEPIYYEGKLYFDTNKSKYQYGQGGAGREQVADEFNIRVSYGDKEGLIYYRDQKKGHLLSREFILDRAFIVKEAAPSFDWQVQPDIKTIGGYSCQLAIGQFRGRTYEAWFTTEVPVSTGPWKLGGLPGLILEAKDQSDQIKFELTAIKIAETLPEDWNSPPTANKTLGYQAFFKLRQKKIDEFYNKFESIPGITVQRRNYQNIELTD